MPVKTALATVAAAATLAAAPAGTASAVACPQAVPADQIRTNLVGVGPGGVAWQVPVGSPAGATDAPEPAVAAGVAYSAAGDELVAVRTSDGAPLWTAALPSLPDEVYVEGANAVVVDGDAVRAFATATGAATWTLPLNGTALFGGAARTVNHGLVVSLLTGGLRTLDLRTGALRWKVSGGGITGVLADTTTVLRSDTSYLAAFDARTGKKLWQTRGRQIGQRVLTGGTVLAENERGGGTGIFAFAERTGKLLWQRTGKDEVPVGGIAGGVLVQKGGRLEFVAPRTGKVRWSAGGTASGAQAAATAKVLSVLEGAKVVGYRVKDGHKVWSAAAPSGGASSGAGSAATQLVTTSHNVGVYAVATGRQFWNATLADPVQGVAVRAGTGAVVVTQSQVTACPVGGPIRA